MVLITIEPLPGTIKDESSVWDGHRWHQIMPRRAVAGDIGDWTECQAWKFAHGDVWEPALIRTVKLMEMNKRMSELLREADDRAANLQDRFNAQVDQIAELQKMLVEQEIEMQRIDTLSSDVDQLQRVIKLYHKQRARQRERIQLLEAQVKAYKYFIELQARRLINARNHLARIRFHCDLPEVGDSGERLDP